MTGGGVSDSETLLTEVELEEERQYEGEEGGGRLTLVQSDHGSVKSRLKATIKKITAFWLIQEAKKLLKISIAISLSIFFQISLLWVSLLFLGHLPNSDEQTGTYQYAAAGLGSSFLNVSGIALGHGIATASDTLSSQAFGNKNYKRVGVVLQRGILILALVVFFVMALWLNTESLLLLFQQPPCIAKYSALYVKSFTLALPFIFLYVLLQHYLQSQSIVWQFVFIGFISNIVNVILHAITIYGIGLGFTGSVISLVVSNMIPPLLVILYVWCRKLHKETWSGWSFESLEEWWQYIKLAIPGVLMVTMEWCGFEILNFLAGTISENALSVNIVWFQALVILYMPPLGVSIATSIRVGNELGAGNPQGAKRASYTAIVLSLFFSLCSIVLLLSIKDVLGFVFVPGNEEVARDVSKLVVYVSWIFMTLDQLQVVLAGMLRGSGRQYIGAVVNFIAYYIIGIPIGATLAFKTDLKELGLWIGMLGGNVFQTSVYLVVLGCTNWQRESEKAIKRSQGPSTPGESGNEANGEQAETSSINSETSSGSDDSNLSQRVLLSNDTELQAMVAEESVQQQNRSTSRLLIPYKLRKILLHGSFFVVGVCILISGGVSSLYHPYVDPDEYVNCTHHENSSSEFLDHS